MNVRWEADGKKWHGPSWSALVDKASEILGFDPPELARIRGTDLQILEYFKLRHSGQTAKLNNWLTRTLDPPNSAIMASKVHQELVELSKVDTFYTTNFDDFLERCMKLRKRKYSVVALESHMGEKRSGCEIVKFHGDLEHPDKIVLTEEDYTTRLKLVSAMDYRLRADLLGRVVLFLGYSFRDPNVSYLFRLFKDDFFGRSDSISGPRAYITVPDPSDFEYKLFDQRSITIIPVSGTRISEDIVELLADMRGA